MNIIRKNIKETLIDIMAEESEYQIFFKKVLDKTGKSIPQMSDSEKKEFFNKIDAAWNARGEKNESVVNEGKFKVDDLVYNKRTKTVGIVRMGDDKHGEVKTDADGNVSVDELEKYNPFKYKHQTKAKVAPSTEREVSKRGLFNPFKLESVNKSSDCGCGGGYSTSINESSKDNYYSNELQRATKRALKGKNIKGWTLFVDDMSGTFEYNKKGIDLVILATPMWDGTRFIPFNVQNDEGDEVDMIQRLIGNKLPFKPTYDIKKDISNYISVLTKALVKVEQAYSKLKL